ncbi:LacI family DNA-binding transcriptional regulator [Paenibacillus sp. YIM B09110]|uniref:LacI family DNA-binding transcriptional regulator n=1 Tax=Paenibacillus sp. YIM B09110 TaxID=3126102 RepID=UPI003FA7D824
MISRKEVAKLAGVSEATVSRVLNNVGPMKEETRERVLRAAAEIGYVPNALAQQFARRKSGNIGVILPFVPKVHLFSTYYFSEILSGIGETAKRCGYDLLLIFREYGGERDYAKLFRTQKIDACIVLGSENVPEERAALAELKREGYPFCLVNQRYDEESYATVDSDHIAGSIAAVNHLIERGRSKIAFLNGPEQYSNSTDRQQGYTHALQEAGMPVTANHIFVGNYSRKSGYELAERIGKAIGEGAIDAVFAANDRMAIGLMQGLREQGYETGRHYSLVGYDDSDSSRIISPMLTTVAVPFYEMGRRAAARLLDAEYKAVGADGELELLPVRLIARETT